MSTLRHITGDRWEVRVYDPTRKSGKRARSFRATGPAAAKRKVAAVEAQLRAEVEHDRDAEGTIGALTTKWLHGASSVRWTPGTREKYERIAADIIAELGHLRADRLRPVDVDEWLMRVAARPGRKPGTTSAPATVRLSRAVLIAMMAQAERGEEIATARAARNSLSPTGRKRADTTPSDELMALLLRTAPPTLQAAAALVVFAGLRVGEVCGLRWSDLAGGVLRVERQVTRTKAGLRVAPPKSESGAREVVVDPALGVLLSTLPRGSGDCYVLPDWRRDANGQAPRSPASISQAWIYHRDKQGAIGVRFHDLRHWHVTTLLQGGVALPTAQARAGHANAATTMIYAHSNPAADAAAAAVIGRILALPAPD